MTTDYKQIVWIASYPKSGSTWVRLFLDAYLLNEVDINEMVCSINDDRTDRAQVGDGSEPWRFPIDIQQLTRPMALLRLVRAYNDGKTMDLPLFVKTHNANIAANGIELLPASLTKATIHIIRDPRDVLPSYAKHMGRELDQAVEMMANKYQTLSASEDRMADFTSSWKLHTDSFMNSPDHNVLQIHYEDMRSDSVETFSRMLEHAGLPVDKDRVKEALRMVDLDKLRKTESEAGFRESSVHAKNAFFGTGDVGGWVNKINEMQAHKITKHAGSTMKRLGYTNSSKRASWH